MARIFNNIFVRGLTGSVGDQFIIRKTRYGQTIIANKPMFDENREFTETQLTHQDAFREATQYAKFAKNHPVYIAIAKANGTGASAYNVAVADWFGAPQVLDINTNGWTGESGQTIRVKAQDNVMVARVSVIIRDAESNVLEQGEAVQSEADGWWDYTASTTVPMTPFPVVEAVAEDLPGNIGSRILD